MLKIAIIIDCNFNAIFGNKKIRLGRILKFFIFQIFVCVPKNSQNIFAILLRRTLANFFLRKNILHRGSEKEKIPNGEYVSLFEQ